MEFAPSLNIIINETLPALQKVQESGKARFIELLDIHSKAFGIKRYAYLLYFFCLFISYQKKIFSNIIFSGGNLFLKLYTLKNIVWNIIFLKKRNMNYKRNELTHF